MLTRRHFIALSSAAPLLGGASVLRAHDHNYVFNTGGVAINGFDPVAYFTEGAPVMGDTRYEVKWEGAVWVLANMENLEMFMADPHRYKPQYGGYCAFAMSKGAVAPTEPDTWTIHDGKLYLNYNLAVRDAWRQDISENVEKADAHWPSALG